MQTQLRKKKKIYGWIRYKYELGDQDVDGCGVDVLLGLVTSTHIQCSHDSVP